MESLEVSGTSFSQASYPCASRYHYEMAAPSPSEIQYQLDHIREDRSSDIVISHIICMTLATVAVILRFTSRRLCKAAILADDYMIIAALV